MGKLNVILTNERKTWLNQLFVKVTSVFVTRITPSQYVFQGTIYQKNSGKPNHDTSWTLPFRRVKKTTRTEKKLFRHTAPIIETVSTELIPQISEKELIPERVNYLTCYLKNIVFQIYDVNWLWVWNINFQSGKRSPQTQKIYQQFLGNS